MLDFKKSPCPIQKPPACTQGSAPKSLPYGLFAQVKGWGQTAFSGSQAGCLWEHKKGKFGDQRKTGGRGCARRGSSEMWRKHRQPGFFLLNLCALKALKCLIQVVCYISPLLKINYHGLICLWLIKRFPSDPVTQATTLQVDTITPSTTPSAAWKYTSLIFSKELSGIQEFGGVVNQLDLNKT